MVVKARFKNTRFNFQLRDIVKANTRGDLQIAVLYLLMNNPAVAKAAETFAAGRLPEETLKNTVELAFSAIARRYTAPRVEVFAAIRDFSLAAVHALGDAAETHRVAQTGEPQ